MYKILGICLLTKKSKIIEGQMFSTKMKWRHISRNKQKMIKILLYEYSA